jgi:hypothetical protein
MKIQNGAQILNGAHGLKFTELTVFVMLSYYLLYHNLRCPPVHPMKGPLVLSQGESSAFRLYALQCSIHDVIVVDRTLPSHWSFVEGHTLTLGGQITGSVSLLHQEIFFWFEPRPEIRLWDCGISSRLYHISRYLITGQIPLECKQSWWLSIVGGITHSPIWRYLLF